MQPILRIRRAGFARLPLVCVLLLLAVFSPLRTRAQARVALLSTVADASRGSVAPVSQPLPRLTLTLKRTAAQQQALEDFLSTAEQPGSATYRRWLTPEQFASQFAPAPERVEAARQWLSAQGFQVGATSPSGMRIAFRGTVLQVNRAFAMTLRRQTAATGSIQISPDRQLAIPADVSDVVANLNGLNPTASGSTDDSTTLADAIDSNAQAVVTVTGDAPSPELAPLLEQAAAQGITVLMNGQGAAAPARVTALQLPTASADAAPFTNGLSSTSADTTAPRPAWQFTPGLPQDGSRATPDASVADTNALANALQGLIAQRDERIGELAPALYRLATGHGIFTHADTTVAAGTWTPSDGLGLIDVPALMKALATGPQASNVSLSASSNTVTHGQALTLTFAVTAPSSTATPAGTVTATLKGRSNSAVTTLGPATLSSTGIATLSTTALPGDLYDLSGSYSGDSNFAANSSNATAITVNPEPATVTVTVPAAAVAVGGMIPVTVSVTSASGVGSPSGTVSVSAYGTAVAATPFTATLSAGTGATSSAVVSVPAANAGSFTFQASCTGNASFSCSAPASAPVTVAKGTPVVTLTSTATPPMVANSATTPWNLVASVAAPAGSNSSAAAPSGTIQVLDNGTPAASFNLVAGKGAYTLSLSNAAHALVAAYSGDANYATANSAAATTTGTLIATTSTITTAVTTTTYGSPVPLTVSVTPASYAPSGAPTGTVTFTSSLQGVIGSARLGNGFVTYSPAMLLAGTHTITASYTSDNSDYASSVTTAGVTVVVATTKATTATTLSVSPNPPFANQLTTLTATIAATTSTGASVPPPFTGTVSFFSKGVFLTKGTVAGNAATAQVRLAPGASISLTASYNGDANYYGSTSPAVMVMPIRVTSAVSLSSNLSMPNAGTSVGLTATVTAANTVVTTAPTGTVTFYSTRNGILNTLGTATLAANGTNSAVASFAANGLAAGLYSITAIYNGDVTFTGATSNAVGIQFGDYGVSFAPSNLYLSRGQSGAAAAMLSVNNGFTGTVVFSCKPPAFSNMTCSFSPATITGGGQTTLTITTTGTVASAQPSHPGDAVGSRSGVVGAGIGAAGLFAYLLPSRRRNRHLLQMGALLLLCCAVSLMSSGCSAGIVGSTNNTSGGTTLPVGGGGGSTGTGVTPYGTFLLEITASSADNTLRHSSIYSVTVQ